MQVVSVAVVTHTGNVVMFGGTVKVKERRIEYNG